MGREYEIVQIVQMAPMGKGGGQGGGPNVKFSSALISTIQFYYKLGRNYSKVGMGNTKLFKGYTSPIWSGRGSRKKNYEHI